MQYYFGKTYNVHVCFSVLSHPVMNPWIKLITMKIFMMYMYIKSVQSHCGVYGKLIYSNSIGWTKLL